LSFDQPRAKLWFVHFSRATFCSPHAFSCVTAHSPAFWMPGEPLSRGPCTSVSQLEISMTRELCGCIPCALILLMAS
jgi:hypothetical protein